MNLDRFGGLWLVDFAHYSFEVNANVGLLISVVLSSDEGPQKRRAKALKC